MQVHYSKLFKHSNLKILYIVTTLVITINILRYNLQYGITILNWVFLPFLLLLFLLPIHYFKFNQFRLTTILYYIFTTIEVTSIVVISGGFNSPALYWLGLSPVLAGLLFGSRGLLIGISSLAFYLSVIYLLNFYSIQLSVIPSKDYLFEKYFNEVLLFLSVCFLTMMTTKSLEKTKENLIAQKNKVATLLRIILHDVSNPLVILRHFSQKLADENDEKAREKIAAKVEELIQILDHTKKIYLLDSQKGKIELEEVDLVQVLGNSIDTAKEYADYKKCRILFSHLMPVAIVKGYAVVFKNEIFDNILTNAVKFSEPRGVIEVKLLEDGSFFHIYIKDTGVGMPESLLKTVFAFDRPTTRVGTEGEVGTGFGLPIVKELVEQFNGYIYMTSKEKTESNMESGTCVKLSFPKEVI